MYFACCVDCCPIRQAVVSAIVPYLPQCWLTSVLPNQERTVKQQLMHLQDDLHRTSTCCLANQHACKLMHFDTRLPPRCMLETNIDLKVHHIAGVLVGKAVTTIEPPGLCTVLTCVNLKMLFITRHTLHGLPQNTQGTNQMLTFPKPKPSLCPHLCEPENVVNKQQHVLALHITEVLSHSQASQGHTGASTGGLIHLAVHQCALRLSTLLAKLDHTLHQRETRSNTVTCTHLSLLQCIQCTPTSSCYRRRQSQIGGQERVPGERQMLLGTSDWAGTPGSK